MAIVWTPAAFGTNAVMVLADSVGVLANGKLKPKQRRNARPYSVLKIYDN
jgi:hypothetical protein